MRHLIPVVAILGLFGACNSASKQEDMPISQLVTELGSTNAADRLAACNALATRNGNEALMACDKLQKLADDDPDPKVQQAAAKAIADIKANELN